MNSTVWTEQICRGFKAYIQNIIKVNADKATPIPVRVKKPDEDFKVEDYPMAYLSIVSISKRDSVRYYPFRVPRDSNPLTHKTYLERTAVPHSIFIQLDFYTTTQSDMDKIITAWDFEASRDINLPVVDSGGTSRTTLALNTGNVINRVDKLSGNNRVFCTSYTYRVWAEIDEENANKRELCDTVAEVAIECQPTN